MHEPFKTRLQHHWDARRSRIEEAANLGQVRQRWVGGRYQVYGAISAGFKALAPSLGGRYRERSGVWSFPGYNAAQVRALIERTRES